MRASDAAVAAACEEAGWDFPAYPPEHLPSAMDVMRDIVQAAFDAQAAEESSS